MPGAHELEHSVLSGGERAVEELLPLTTVPRANEAKKRPPCSTGLERLSMDGAPSQRRIRVEPVKAALAALHDIRRSGNQYDHPNWHFIDYPLLPHCHSRGDCATPFLPTYPMNPHIQKGINLESVGG